MKLPSVGLFLLLISTTSAIADCPDGTWASSLYQGPGGGLYEGPGGGTKAEPDIAPSPSRGACEGEQSATMLHRGIGCHESVLSTDYQGKKRVCQCGFRTLEVSSGTIGITGRAECPMNPRPSTLYRTM